MISRSDRCSPPEPVAVTRSRHAAERPAARAARWAVALVAVVGLVLLGGCGDDDGDATASSTTPPPTDTSPPTTAPPGEQIDVADLEAGVCFDYRVVPDEEGQQVEAVVAVDCGLPHDNEVYAVVEHPGARTDPYPGTEAMTDFANSECIAQFEGFVGRQYELSELEVGHVTPTPESWDERDRTVICFVFQREGEKLTGSASGTDR